MNQVLIALMAPPPNPDGTPGAQPGFLESVFFPLAMMMVIIYFLIFRPQQKRAETQKKTLEGLKKGDWVLANAGFYGRVTDLEKKTVTVEIANNVRIRLLREAIAAVQNPDDLEAAASK